MRFALINPSWQAPPARITARFKASNLRWLRQAILRRIRRKGGLLALLQISATLQGSTLGNDGIMPPCPTGGGCNKNIVTL